MSAPGAIILPQACEENNCPICMTEMLPFVAGESEEIAMLPCNHPFHDGCIAEWIKTATSCPYCRREFDRIDVLHELGGVVQRSYPVISKLQEADEDDGDYDEEDEDDEPYNSNYEDDMRRLHSTRCIICGSQEREDILMICDSCEDCYHSFCLGEEELRTRAFFCPTCVVANVLQHDPNSAVRTVATLQGPRRRRGRRIRSQETQLATWTAAWNRVRERAWARLNEELDYEPIVEEGLTANQEEELRQWRERFDRRGQAVTRIAAKESPVVEEDPATASLWRAFEQASKFSKAGATTTSSVKSSRNTSPKSPVGMANNAALSMAQTSGGSTQKQKRPNTSARKASTSAQKRPASPSSSTTTTPCKRLALSTTTTPPQGSFLSSILSDIKQPRSEQPVKVLPTSAPASAQPMSTASLSTSAASSPAVSPSHDHEPTPSIARPITTKTVVDKGKSASSSSSTTITKAQIAHLVSTRLKPFYKKEITKEEFIQINGSITRRIFPDFADASGTAPGVLDDLRRRVKSEVNEELHLC